MNRSTMFALAALACTPANATELGTPPGVAFTLQASGDTVTLTGSWSAGRGATGYVARAAQTVTTGTWTYLPPGNPQTLTARAATFRAVNTTADSADFQLCVRSTRGTRQTAESCSVLRRWIRVLLPPDTVRIDTITVMGVTPLPAVGLASVPIGGSLQFCPFVRFSTNHVAMRQLDATSCMTRYLASFTVAERALLPVEQQWIDCITPYVCPAGYRVIDGFDSNPLRRADGS